MAGLSETFPTILNDRLVGQPLHICPALNASGIKPSTHRGKSLLICAEIGYYDQRQRRSDFSEPDLRDRQ